MRGKRIAIAGASLALLVLAYFGPSTYRKSQMDAEVERLCAIDGGVKVYLRTELPKSMFDLRGYPSVPFVRDLRDAKEEYAFEDGSGPIQKGDPSGRWVPTLHRTHIRLVRVNDSTVMAEAIGYARSGGDPVGPWQPSSYRGSCLPLGFGLGREVFSNWKDGR
jgi:hypothetical protein